MRLWRRIYILLLGATLMTVSIAQEYQLEIQPSGSEQIKPLNDNLVFTCIAHVSDESLLSSLTWIGPDGQPVPREERKYTEAITKSRSMLFIKHIQDGDQGTYKCVAQYVDGESPEVEVKLSTFMDITFEDAPEQQYVIYNKTAKIRCKVIANPSPVVDWQKDGVPFKPNERCILEQDGIMCSYFIEDDEGQYTCRARVTSTGRMLERTIRLGVNIPPKIDSLQKEHHALEDNKLTMTCHATGKPVPKMDWLDKNNAELMGREGYIVDQKSGELIIEKVSREDKGIFTCVASNSAGETRSVTNLHVVIKPKIKEFANVTAVKDKEAVISCRVHADPPAKVEIEKIGSQTRFDKAGVHESDERIYIGIDEEGDDTVFTLSIRNVRDDDDGLYKCIATAKSEALTVEAIGHLTVEFAPVFDQTPQAIVKSWDRHTVNLTCIARSIPNATITWSTLAFNLDEDPNTIVMGNKTTSVLQISTFDPKYYTNYICHARNEIGTGNFTITLQEAKPPGPLMQVTFETVTATTITFRIVGPSDDGGHPLTGYLVEYSEERGEDKSRFWTIDSSYILEKLEPEKRYSFRFAAENRVGRGPYTDYMERVMPKKAAPEEPSLIMNQNTSPYSDKIEVRWKTPADNGDRIDHFQISYYSVKDGSNNAERTGKMETINERNPGNNLIVLDKLQPDTYYRIEVRAHNSIGYSSPGQQTIKTALGSVPDQQQSQISGMSMVTIIGIVVVIFIVLLVIVDISCYFVNKCGLTMCLCVHVCGKKNPGNKGKEMAMEDGKGKDSHTKKPLNHTDNGDGCIKEPNEESPMIHGDKEKEALKDAMENDSRIDIRKSPHGSKSSIAKDSPV